MDNRPIGIFDSGVGGLTTLQELSHIMPNESIVYFGDTGRVPYGTKSNETIQKFALQDMRFLQSKDVKLLIAACGTVSSVLPLEVANTIPLPYVGVPKYAAAAAQKATKNGKIGIIATTATIKSGAYEKALLGLDDGLKVFANACPLFVPLVENGFTDVENAVTLLVAKQYLAELQQAGVDTLILGCTHYPIIKALIGSVMGKNVTLIDSGQEAARGAAEYLTQSGQLNHSKSPAIYNYYVSDTVEEFMKNATAILQKPINGSVEKIDIEQY